MGAGNSSCQLLSERSVMRSTNPFFWIRSTNEDQHFEEDSCFDLWFLVPFPNLGCEVAGWTIPISSEALLSWSSAIGAVCHITLPLTWRPSLLPWQTLTCDPKQYAAGWFHIAERKHSLLTNPSLQRCTAISTNSPLTSTSYLAALLLLAKDFSCLWLVPFSLPPSFYISCAVSHSFTNRAMWLFTLFSLTFLSACCPADWAWQSLSPATAGRTSPPTFPSPSHQPSEGFLSPSLSLSFSTPPTFSANPRRRILPRESSSLKSSLLPLLLTCRGGGRKRLHSHSPAAGAGGFAAGRWLWALGNYLSPSSRAWDLSSSSFRSSLYGLMVSLHSVWAGLLCLEGELYVELCYWKKNKTPPT